ncbi:MAG: hypothetical protein NT030_02225 [Candidatus Saganbacteria bacterium]|nr:hypothetical protein [Candidatus Saganbacteria bacterium]
MFKMPAVPEMIKTGESFRAETEKPLKGLAPKSKKCLYLQDVNCTAPNCKMDICANCPYGRLFSIKSVIGELFKKIVGLAVFFMKSDSVASKISKSGSSEVSGKK